MRENQRETGTGRLRPLGEAPPGREPTHYAPVIDERIAEMRALLASMRPASDSEALQALRRAFPEASLALRVAALSGGR